MEFKFLKRIIVVVACILQAACGGGSGGGSSGLSATPTDNSTSSSSQGTSTGTGTSSAGTSNTGSSATSTATSSSSNTGTVPATTPSESVPTAASSYSKATDARFRTISVITIDDAGNLYVYDQGTIRKIAPSGSVTTLAGAPGQGGIVNGTGPAARFTTPTGIAVDHGGNIYLTETTRIVGEIRKITPQGVVTTILDNINPTGITVDNADTIYFTTNGAGPWIAYFNADMQPLQKAVPDHFSPQGLVTDAAGNLYIITAQPIDVSPGGAYTATCTLEKVSPSGITTTLAGQRGGVNVDTCGSVDGIGEAAKLQGRHLTIDAAGNLFVAGLDAVRKVTQQGEVTTLVRRADPSDSFGAKDITIDKAGNLYVVNGSEVIYKVTQNGVVSVIAGKAGEPGYVDVP